MKYLFQTAKFTLDFKTKKCLYICLKIKGKFRSFEIYISFKKGLNLSKQFAVKGFFNSVLLKILV